MSQPEEKFETDRNVILAERKKNDEEWERFLAYNGIRSNQTHSQSTFDASRIDSLKPGEAAVNDIKRCMENKKYQQSYVHGGKDVNWEKSAFDMEWKVKFSLNYLMTMNVTENLYKEYTQSGKVVEDLYNTVLQRHADSIKPYFGGIINNLGLSQDMFTSKDHGIVIKPQDLFSDGKKILSIGEDGSITTFNDDGSVRGKQSRREVVEEFNKLRPNDANAHFSMLYRNDPNADSRLIY